MRRSQGGCWVSGSLQQGNDYRPQNETLSFYYRAYVEAPWVQL